MKNLLKGIYPLTAVYFVVALLLLVFSEIARADYFYAGIERSDYRSGENWRDTSSGYDLQDNNRPIGYMLAYVKEYDGYNIRYAVHNFGQASRSAFWSGTYDSPCKTCGTTVMSYQTQDSVAASVAYQPTIFERGDTRVYATIGGILHDTTFVNMEFQANPGNSHKQTWTSTQAIHHTGLTYVAGIGISHDRIGLELEHAPIDAEGEGSYLGGSGAYNDITSLRIVYKF